MSIFKKRPLARLGRSRGKQALGLRGSRGLRGTEEQHLAMAKAALSSGWSDLESLPPTCEGGIQRSASALANMERATTHLAEVNDPAVREANTELFGLRNMGNAAAWQAIRFFSQTCKVPGREAAERPSFSRAKALEVMRKQDKKRKRGRK